MALKRVKKIKTKKVNVSTNVGIQLHRVSLETLKINRNRDGCMSDWFVQILINGYSCACKFGIFSEFHKFCKLCECGKGRVDHFLHKNTYSYTLAKLEPAPKFKIQNTILALPNLCK
jgi:hypothetical protein